MTKLQLPTVTLLIVDCVDARRAAHVLDICKAKADFGAVKLLTSQETDSPHAVKIPALRSLVAYSIFMLTKAHEYVETEHMLIVQRDGWILNPQAWSDEWLKMDYIGPLFIQYDKVGSGGFSLRSRRMMKYIASTIPEWDWTQELADDMQKRLGMYEDGIIALSNHKKLFRIASVEHAANFAQGGNKNPRYFREYSFGFHRTWQCIDFTTGRIDSSDNSRDLHVSYDHLIDEL